MLHRKNEMQFCELWLKCWLAWWWSKCSVYTPLILDICSSTLHKAVKENALVHILLSTTFSPLWWPLRRLHLNFKQMKSIVHGLAVDVNCSRLNLKPSLGPASQVMLLWMISVLLQTAAVSVSITPCSFYSVQIRKNKLVHLYATFGASVAMYSLLFPLCFCQGKPLKGCTIYYWTSLLE